MSKRLLPFIALAVVLAGLLLYSQWGREPFKVSGFIETDEIRLGSRVGGRVKRVLAAEGQAVKAGDVLVELEPFDLLERRAEAEKQLDAKKAEFDRLRAGFREEEKAQARAHRDQLAARLEKLKNGPREQEIRAAEAQVKLAEAEVELAQREFNRLRALVRTSASTQEELDRAANVLKTNQQRLLVRNEELSLLKAGTRPEEIEEAKAQLQEAEAALKLRLEGYRPEEVAQAKAAVGAAQAALDALDRQLEELKIRAPGPTAVEALDLQPGDLVAPNAPVIALVDQRNLWVRAYVPENRLTVQLGQDVAVTTDSFPGERFAARVTFIARQAEFTPGNVQTPEERSKQVFRIKVQLDEGLDRMRPGMAADVWLPGGAKKD